MLVPKLEDYHARDAVRELQNQEKFPGVSLEKACTGHLEIPGKRVLRYIPQFQMRDDTVYYNGVEVELYTLSDYSGRASSDKTILNPLSKLWENPERYSLEFTGAELKFKSFVETRHPAARERYYLLKGGLKELYQHYRAGLGLETDENNGFSVPKQTAKLNDDASLVKLIEKQILSEELFSRIAGMCISIKKL